MEKRDGCAGLAGRFENVTRYGRSMNEISNFVPASFEGSDRAVEVGARGQHAHHRQFAQAERFEPRMCVVAPGVWFMVGNGLSNQTFVEGPDGIIAIDTGESIEEMAAALARCG